MPTLTANRLLDLLAQFVRESRSSVDLLVVGALALHMYGVSDRATRDVDGELNGPLAPLLEFLTTHEIPADLTQNFSGWSIVAMPPGYRERATSLVNQPNLHVRVLAPLDFVIAKLRRGTDLDCDDALLVARHYQLSVDSVQASARASLALPHRTPRSFCFRKQLTSSAKVSLLQTSKERYQTTPWGAYLKQTPPFIQLLAHVLRPADRKHSL